MSQAFFYDLGKRVIVLADRGVGVLATLQRASHRLRRMKMRCARPLPKYITGRARNTGAMV